MQLRAKMREEGFFMIERRINKNFAIWVAAIGHNCATSQKPESLIVETSLLI
jgi:hypothetical protein